PIHIFKVKEGVNYNPEDPNYDLFKLSMRVSAKRLFPNYVFLDAPFNLQYYKPNCPESEVATMGCRTRVMGNVYDPTREIANSRGNLSFTSINLPRLAIESHGDENVFYSKLDDMLALVTGQLLDRFEIQARKKVRNYPFLMGQGVWLDSEKLGPDDEVREVLKHGSLSIGFIGLAETLVALYGHHHGESAEMQKKGLEIVGRIRAYADKMAEKYHMNFGVLATPAEGLSGRFVRMDKKLFGEIKGVTDREYYTNSFHIPVYFDISAYKKIELEAPYHALTNAGHISYVEMDGDTANNIEAFEKVVRCMHDNGIGYGSINHPVDRDPVCGFNGIINDECPGCHRHLDDEKAMPVERIRRITGYLVGTLDRFNDAKRAEEHDRVKHTLD
ncbi:MAG: anaerobic ribonucleoside-triphosphate reductase, partial [Oscillospiraceae bacterium]